MVLHARRIWETHPFGICFSLIHTEYLVLEDDY
jgi:hypothetical protein